MIRPDQIPDEAVEAAAIAIMGRIMVGHSDALLVWNGLYEPEKVQFRREARAAIAAALGAWPGAHVHEWQRPWLGGMSGTDIVLPMPQEASD